MHINSVHMKVMAALVSSTMVVAGCGQATSDSVGSAPGAAGALKAAANLPTAIGSLSGLVALPSASPASGYEGGGGGLVGDAWVVWGLPGSRSADDPGISVNDLPVATVLGLRPTFTAQGGKGTYEFVVQDMAGKNTLWDSGDAGGNDACSITDIAASCTLPEENVGLLKNGSTYRLVTTAGGVTTPRLFKVDAMPGASGATGALIRGRSYSSSVAQTSWGIGFSTADQGPTPGTAATDGVRSGLPAGWEWVGPVGGLISIDREANADEYTGYTQLLTISGAENQTLGCQAGSAGQAVCGQIGQGLVGEGLVAVINSDNTVDVTDQASGMNWTFDAANNLIGQAGPGIAPIIYTYRTLGSATTPVLASMSIPAAGWTWTVQYAGDPGCQDSSLPAGFIAAPAGYACGWKEPAGDYALIQYSQPSGATVPRVSQVVQVPASCPTWQSCDTSQLGVFDLGWDDHNRILYQRQDSAVDAAVLGNISEANTDFWATQQFDDLGRLQSVTQMELKGNGSGNSGAVGGSQVTYSYSPADTQYAPATREIVSTTSVNGGPTLTSTIAFDDAGRHQFTIDTDGVVTQEIWDPDKQWRYGVITGNYQVSGSTYDQFGRITASATGDPKSFNLSTCSPNAANRSSTSCMPSNGSADAALATRSVTFDEVAGTGNGLKAQWFNNGQFSGSPLATNVVSQNNNGFGISPPGGSGLGDGWGVSLSGGLILNAASTWSITVNVPKGMFSGGALYVGGSVCALIVSGQTQSKCTFASQNAAYPVTLALAHASGAQSSGNVAITLQQNEFKPPVISNANYLPNWGVATTRSSTDHTADGTAVNYSSTYGYGTPITTLADRVTTLPVDQSSGGITGTVKYQSNGFGGAMGVSATTAGGATRTVSYYGLGDTPAGLPNASEIPAALHGVRQNGLVKINASAAGRQQWYVYDQYGQIACQADVMTGTDPQWSCETRDGRGRLVSATIKGQDGQPDIDLSYQYLFDANPDDSPFVVQTTKTQTGSQPLTDETREWIGGLQDSYIGPDGSSTQTTYDSSGNPDTAITQVNVAGAMRLQALALVQGAASAAKQPTATPKASPPPAKTPNPAPSDARSAASKSSPAASKQGQATAASSPSQATSQPAPVTPSTNASQTASATPSPSASQTVPATPSPVESLATPAIPSGLAGDSTIVLHFGYDDMSRQTTVSDGSSQLVQINYDENDPRKITGYDYLGGSVKQSVQFDQFNRPRGSTWTLADGTLNTSMTTSAAGIVAADSFDNVSDKYTYDPFGRLTQADMQVGDQTHSFSYGWDVDNSRTCAAADIANPQQKPCSQLAGAATFTYKNGQLTSSTSQNGNIPAGSLTKDGSYSQIGDQSYQFDAARQLVAVTEAATVQQATKGKAGNTPAPASAPASQISFLRDANNRLVAQTTTSGGTTQGFSTVYAGAGKDDQIATVSGSSVTRLLSLPGGLTLRGDTPTIQSASGTAVLQLNPDGSRGQNQTQIWGPYGESLAAPSSTSATVPGVGWHGTNGLLDGDLISLGARGYRADMAMFLQPDPVMGGSATINDYAYVSGDPINSSDLTGTLSSMWVTFIGNLTAMALEFPILEGLYQIVDRLPEQFFTVMGGAFGKALSFALNASVNVGMTLGLSAVLNHGSINIGDCEIAVTFLTAVFSGYLGSTFAGVRAKALGWVQAAKDAVAGVSEAAGGANNVMERVNQAIEQVQAGVAAVNNAVNAGADLAGQIQQEGAIVALAGQEGVNQIKSTVTTVARYAGFMTVAGWAVNYFGGGSYYGLMMGALLMWLGGLGFNGSEEPAGAEDTAP